MPVYEPDDFACRSSFPDTYVFAFMEPAEWTGEVTHYDGTTEEITVPVMQDSRTGIYYLGDLDRKIVSADMWSRFFGDTLKLTSSEGNTGWNDKALIAYYNYIRAYDFYKNLGWNSPDGRGTPILIAQDWCEKDQSPVDNAAYVGNLYGWQIFAASQGNSLQDSMDVIGHEFTHCVTERSMVSGEYLNDLGAINEALSDIMGKMIGNTYNQDESEKWLLGADSDRVVRNMGDPRTYNQPEYEGDIFYGQAVEEGVITNDYGGVHTNSSLLNLIQYKLIEEAGMSTEDAIRFWETVDFTLTPGTDYPLLKDHLLWALAECGLDSYREKLEEFIEESRITYTDEPALEEDLIKVNLTLPDTEAFQDNDWVLYTVWLDTSDIEELFSLIMSSDKESPELQERLDQFGKNMEQFGEEFRNAQEDENKLAELMNGHFIQQNTWRGKDSGNTISQKQRRGGRAIYLLLNMNQKEETFSQVDINEILVYSNNGWIEVASGLELSGVFEEINGQSQVDINPLEMLQSLFKGYSSLEKLFSTIPDVLISTGDGQEYNLNPAGLEDVILIKVADREAVARAAAEAKKIAEEKEKAEEETVKEIVTGVVERALKEAAAAYEAAEEAVTGVVLEIMDKVA